MNKITVVKRKADWLRYSLNVGFSEGDVNELEKFWDSYFNQDGERMMGGEISKQFVCWEYHTMHLAMRISDEEINAYGEKGWELISASMAQGNFYYVFKRQLK